MVVTPHPLGGKFLCLFNALKEMQIQPFMACSSVEPFDVCILGRLSWLDKQELDSLFGSPRHQVSARVFRAIVTADAGRFPPQSGCGATTMKDPIPSHRQVTTVTVQSHLSLNFLWTVLVYQQNSNRNQVLSLLLSEQAQL